MSKFQSIYDIVKSETVQAPLRNALMEITKRAVGKEALFPANDQLVYCFFQNAYGQARLTVYIRVGEHCPGTSVNPSQDAHIGRIWFKQTPGRTLTYEAFVEDSLGGREHLKFHVNPVLVLDGVPSVCIPKIFEIAER